MSRLSFQLEIDPQCGLVGEWRIAVLVVKQMEHKFALAAILSAFPQCVPSF